MARLSADQRNDHYLQAAVRTGIHKPLLAALAAAQQRPTLSDGELGLGISPANRIRLDQVNTFAEQVEYAANTVRSITNRLIGQGWDSAELWQAEQGRYSDRFLDLVASGHVPDSNDAAAARLEPTHALSLQQSYLADWELDCKAARLGGQFTWLDAALLRFSSEVPRYYLAIRHQRRALLEATRLWHQLEDQQAAIALLRQEEPSPGSTTDATQFDQPLLQQVQQFSSQYGGYPHQREALLRLVQLWQQYSSREVTIAHLESAPTAEISIRTIDPALMALVQRIPQTYQGKGDQRNALTETYRLWYGLDSRSAALQDLGLDAQVLTASNPNRTALITAATQFDRALLDFVKRIPSLYAETELQREALIRLSQTWQGFESRDQALQALLDRVQQLETARRDSPDAAPKLEPIPLPPRPHSWTPSNLQLHAAITSSGSFTWAEATQGGRYCPSHPATVEAIVQIAELAQQAYDRIGRPFCITTWYRPLPELAQTASPGLLRSLGPERYSLGDAIEFYCDGLTGNQLYQALDPWWTGGLGRYKAYPYLCYIDARPERVRWTLD
jgi:hypothetical protein